MNHSLKKIYSMFLCVMAAGVLSSCLQEGPEPEISLPDSVAGGKVVIGAAASEFTFEIKSQGDWKLEQDAFFFSVFPEEGSGDATITVFVQENKSDARKYGKLEIVFEKGNKRSLSIEQQWKGETQDNSITPIQRSNSVYAVGYGYDTTEGRYADPASVKGEILNTALLIKTGELYLGTSKSDVKARSVTGSSITEVSNNLSAGAEVSGGIFKFKMEANANFNMKNSDNSTHEYAINFIDAYVQTVHLNGGIGVYAERKYMNDDAYKAINGLNPHYPSTDEGFKKLIKAYGTHIIVNSILGGRVRQTLDVDITKISGSYDIKAFAKASYGGVVKAGVSVDEAYRNSFEENKSSIEKEIEVYGGTQETQNALEGSFTTENYEKWLHTLTGEYVALMGFQNEDSLVPLYEMVDIENHKSRFDSLKSYMTGERIHEDFKDNSTYDSGTVVQFTMPTFDSKNNFKTLVKEIMIDGQSVGVICEEYVPVINKERRVMVVYPRIGSKVRYNMGFFIGDENHQPARVSWNGTDTAVSAYDSDEFGETTTLFLRGGSVTTTCPIGAEVKQGWIKDLCLGGSIVFKEKNVSYDYPIVKIFDHLWTRIDYGQSSSTLPDTGRNSIPWKNELYHVSDPYYVAPDGSAPGFFPRMVYPETVAALREGFPTNWHVPTLDVYKSMTDKASNSTESLAGQLMVRGGLLGYEAVFVGYFNGLDWQGRDGSVVKYITSDSRYFAIYSDGSAVLAYDPEHMNGQWMVMRLVKSIDN